MNQTDKLSASEILKKHEYSNEMHFHDVDRKWIIEAMEEYAQQALEQYKGDGWVSEFEEWVEDTFSKTNDYGTSLTATGEQIMQKIKELKSPPQTKTI